MRIRILAATVAMPVAAFLLADAAGAASCREQLEDFERKLNDSSLAATEPEVYASLAREAANAAELRDEQLCMQRVAELNDALAAGATPQPVTSATPEAPSETPPPAPPAAPLLLEAAPADYAVESSSEEPPEPPPDEDAAD